MRALIEQRLKVGLGVIVLLLLWACSGGGGSGGVSTGSLRIVGEPAGARVFVNGVQRGTAPLDLRNLPAGTHHIRIEITENGQIIAQEFTVEVGSQLEVRYDLNRYRIEANPATVRVLVGQSQQVVATMRDANGNAIEATFEWSIENRNVATVTSSGANACRVQGVQIGSTYLVIKDTRTGMSLRMLVVVQEPPPYRIEANPSQVAVMVGQSQRVEATLRDANGNIVEANFTWSIENPSLATVTSSEANACRVQGVQIGSTYLIITDTRTGVSLRVRVVVEDFPPPPGN
jgi:hypothetical protein